MDIEAERRRLAATFDGIAALYDAARPRHPEALIAHVIETAQLPPAGQVLEIGAGPGIATLPFAERGFEVLCLEPGAALAARCRNNLAAFPLVRVIEARFEDWEIEAGQFDLVMAAQSFHWTDPATAYGRVAEALRPGGWLAIFGNAPSPPPPGEPLHAAVQAAYARHAPDLGRGRPDGHGDYGQRIAGSGRYEEPRFRSFPWIACYDTDHYLQLLRTQSDHRSLGAAALEALLADVGSAIEAHGGVREVAYEARLWMARTHPGTGHN